MGAAGHATAEHIAIGSSLCWLLAVKNFQLQRGWKPPRPSDDAPIPDARDPGGRQRGVGHVPTLREDKGISLEDEAHGQQKVLATIGRQDTALNRLFGGVRGRNSPVGE